MGQTCAWAEPEVKPIGGGIEIVFGPDRPLSCQQVEALGAAGPTRCDFSPAAARAMAASHAGLEAAASDGRPIYGLTTGFGPHVKYSASACADRHGQQLIAHLGAGWGLPAPAPVARATLALRCQAVAQGCSGIDPSAASAMLRFLGSGLAPAMPEVGSVGASGDLIPLAHAASALAGEGFVVDDSGRRLPAGPALCAAGLDPIRLRGRDALAMVNGTSFMSAYAALAAARGWRLIQAAESLTGWIYRTLGCRAQALDPRLHEARGHPGQIRSAESILEEAVRFGAWEDPGRPLQEVYSLRCAPQFFGACRDQMAYARGVIEREINGVNDNPVVVAVDGPADVLHGGNFQGQQIAFAADAINAALVQAAVVLERQLDVLCNPELSGGPLLLAAQPGSTSGLAGVQITATALVAEMRHHGGPAATASIPTNGRNQDVVSMGTLAARAAFGQTARLAAVAAATAIGAAQLNFLRARGLVPGPVAPPPEWMPPVECALADRAWYADLDRLARATVSPERAGTAPVGEP